MGCVLSLLTQWCGINAVNFYSVTLFTQVANGDFTIINMLTVGDGVISMVVCMIAGLIINRFGRRIVFLVGNGVCAVSLSVLAGLYFLLDSTTDQSTFNLL